MHGNTFTRSTRAITQMLLHPSQGIGWIGNVLHRRSPLELGLPWMSWSAIELLRQHVGRGVRVFEWGGGGSTRFFVESGCQVTTVESSRQWADAIEKALPQQVASGALQLRFFEVADSAHAQIQGYIKAVHDGAPWDIVVIDGLEEQYLSRVDCMRETPGCVKPGGLAVLDDSWRDAYRVSSDIFRGWKHVPCQGLGPARLGVTRTDFFTAPA